MIFVGNQSPDGAELYQVSCVSVPDPSVAVTPVVMRQCATFAVSKYLIAVAMRQPPITGCSRG